MNCEKLQSNTGRGQSEIYLLSMNEKEILIGFVHIWVSINPMINLCTQNVFPDNLEAVL